MSTLIVRICMIENCDVYLVLWIFNKCRLHRNQRNSINGLPHAFIRTLCFVGVGVHLDEELKHFLDKL